MRPQVKVQSYLPFVTSTGGGTGVITICPEDIQDYKVCCDITVDPVVEIVVQDAAKQLQAYIEAELHKYLAKPIVDERARLTGAISDYLASLLKKEESDLSRAFVQCIPARQVVDQDDYDAMRQAFQLHTHYPAGNFQATGI
jgi:hypothetical protein